MAVQKRLALIPGTDGSAPMELLAPEKKSSGFRSRERVYQPIIDITPSSNSEFLRAGDRVSKSVSCAGMCHKAEVLFSVARSMMNDDSGVRFSAGSEGIFMGETRIGEVSGLRSSPLMKIWLDRLFLLPGKGIGHPDLFGKIPLSALVTMFFVSDAVKFANQLYEAKYASVYSDPFTLYLGLHDKKRGEPSETYLANWQGIRSSTP